MLNWIKSHLVDDVKDAWKWWSVRANVIALALPVAWAALPYDFQQAIPGGIVTAMAAASFLALIGRTVKQK